jgi:hypothetical protein
MQKAIDTEVEYAQLLFRLAYNMSACILVSVLSLHSKPVKNVPKLTS